MDTRRPRRALALLALVAAGCSSGPGLQAAPPTMPVGVGSHPWVFRNDPAAALTATTALHVGLLRVDALWRAVEPRAGDARWDELDTLVGESTSHGIRPILVLHGTPAWANAGRGSDAPPTSDAAFAAFCGQAAARYADKGVVYEVWNEENAPFGWGGPVQPRRYAALLEACSAAIRSADAKATVLVGGLARSRAPGVVPAAGYVRALLGAGAGGAFDGVAFHPYALDDATAPGSSLAADVPAIHQVLADAGRAQTPIWLTEFGYPIGPRRSAADVARLERRAILYAARRYPYVAGFVIYELSDEGSTRFGLYDRGWTPRAAARMLADLLEGGGAVR